MSIPPYHAGASDHSTDGIGFGSVLAYNLTRDD
jgi:hypothetical protein